MTWHLDGGELNQDIFDALAGLCPQLLKRAGAIADQHALPLSCVKAVHLLGTPLSMKELARRMHCDPSFITVTADTLEERGLAKLESDATDRRIRNLVLTPRGRDLRQRLEQAPGKGRGANAEPAEPGQGGEHSHDGGEGLSSGRLERHRGQHWRN